ncbi:AI-2E family transporter [Tumidithrix elongata RA019]|uniref:AI-2E family transporter n=1 Tax=Tumidithrix elongata BACA0141 TaxID=2716417 RepID=A0AAW9Q2R3_9CYAN|nr:AI-2E family transporter [Tumidithrix elongata RA019]
MNQKSLFWRYFRRVAIAIVAIYLVFRLRQTVQLLLTSLFFAGAITPLVQQMTGFRLKIRNRWDLGLNRGWAVGIIYTVFLLVLIITIAPAPKLLSELGQFFTQFPTLVEKIRIPKDGTFLGMSQQQLNNLLQKQPLLDQVQVWGRDIAGQAVDTTLKLFNALGIGLLSMLITGYMVVNSEQLLNRVLSPFSPEIQHEVRELIPPITRCLGAYVLGKIGTSTLLGFCIYLTLTFFDVQFAGALGLLVAVANLIPYVGGFLGLIPIAIAAWSLGTTQVFFAVFICFTLQQIEAFFLQPWLVAPYLNLDPFELLLSIIIGAELLGVVGALIAPPVAGVARIMFNRFYQKYRDGNLNSSESEKFDKPPEKPIK